MAGVLSVELSHFIGSHYVVLLINRPDGAARHFCVLCAEMTDDASSHIVSRRHRLNYLALHFESLHDALMGPENEGFFVQQAEFPEAVIAAIAKEANSGVCYVYDYDFFINNQAEVCRIIVDMRHINESDMSDVMDDFLATDSQEIPQAPDEARMILESVDNRRSPDNSEAAADLQQAFDAVVAEYMRKNPGLAEAEARQVAKDHMKNFPY